MSQYESTPSRRCSECTPACLARATTVLGLSPEMILTSMPASENSSSVPRTPGRSSSLKQMRASASRPAGRTGGASGSALKAAGSASPANMTTRRPRAAHSSARPRQSAPAASAGARISGAPSTYVPRVSPSAKARPLHLRSDEKNASCAAVWRSAGNAVRSASIVRLASVVLAAKAPSRRAARASSAPSPASSSNVTTPEVSVPVLSVQRTSTLLRLSTALNCCTSTSLPSRRMAPSA